MTTIRELDNNSGNIWTPGPVENWSSIDYWYSNVLDKSIDALEVEDLCRLVRQQWHLKAISERILFCIDNDINCGYLSESELLEALIEAPPKAWNQFDEVGLEIKKRISINIDKISDEEIKQKCVQFLNQP